LQKKNPNAQKTHEKMLTIPGIKEMQIKTTLRFHLTPVRIASSKIPPTNVGEDMGKKEHSYTTDGNEN
jgi:hypothetical protein